jgi:hypothetical protein
VLGSDKTVGFAARLVALHIDHFERDEHNALYRDLEDKAFALEAAYDDGEEGDAILTRIAAVEDAKAALDEADEKRIALKTLGIARTHAAIAHSLREGAEFDDILAAQQTIIELVEETDDLVKTVEDAGDAEE